MQLNIYFLNKSVNKASISKNNCHVFIIDDDMARQRKQIYAQGNALIRKFYMCTETVRISLHVQIVLLLFVHQSVL